MSVEFRIVESDEQVRELAKLASEIWHEFFVSILSVDQIDYMVDKFLSYFAILENKKQGYDYYFIEDQNDRVGFVAFKLEEKKLFLSKLYVKREYRGKGYASQTFQFLENQACLAKKEAIYLTVNKYNASAIHVYERKGFNTIESVVTDIGNGFVMDDYIMEKEVRG